MEGEPFLLETWLFSETGVEGARLTVSLREATGRPLGSQTTSVDVPPERSVPVRLHLPEPPLRDGRFFVDVSVFTHDGDRELALVERALELSVFSRDAASGGPVRLGGAWELPQPDASFVVEAAER
jgi:hypothetical protein